MYATNTTNINTGNSLFIINEITTGVEKQYFIEINKYFALR